MEPEHLRFGGGASLTVLHPVVAIAVLIAGLCIIGLPRRNALVAFLTAAILVPTDQVLVIGSLHFSMLRILALFGLVRVAWSWRSSSRRLFAGGFNRIDLALVLSAAIVALNSALLWQQSAPLIMQVGEIVTAGGVYFLARTLIRSQEDVEQTIRTLAYIAAVVAVVMVIEQVTGWNPYALLGGARSWLYASLMKRGDHFRAMGCFAQPILAGTFGAVLLPLFVGLWLANKTSRPIAVLGILSASVITVASNSSTPVLAYAAGLLAVSLWPVRNWMRIVRWGIVFTLVGLHVVMKAPVWHLISRVDISGGSASYHRYMLVDQFIRRFGDWWLVGTKSNAEWGWSMWDLANQYVAVGQTSGLLALLLFLAVIVYGFKYLGMARRRTGSNRKMQLLLWLLGATLFGHVVAYFGISYFDQTSVTWYTLLAMISAMTMNQRRTRRIAISRTVGVLGGPPNWCPDPSASLTKND